MRNFRVLHGILVHVSTKPSASTPPPSGKVPRAVGTAQGRASLMLHALIYLIFGIITVFVQTPDNVFTKILLGFWMLALGTSHALTARGMHYGPATSTSLSSTALGTLMPILREQGVLDRPLGRAFLAQGTVGELGPVAAMAILLSSNSPWVGALVLIGFGVLTAAPATA